MEKRSLEASGTRMNKQKRFKDEKVEKQPTITRDRSKLVAWQARKIAAASPVWKTHTKNILQDGYTIFKNVLPRGLVELLLKGEEETREKSHPHNMRKRKGNQKWMGAIKSIHAHIHESFGTQTVHAPLTIRAAGRYDMPIPDQVASPILAELESRGIVDFLKFLCNRGRFRTHDILLSKAGSARQDVHTDSSWRRNSKHHPTTNYITVLIPLTKQDKIVGGTRVWPGTHRLPNSNINDEDYVDCIHPVLSVGDALLFDGLLSHCGLENSSGILDENPRDRYFYYSAFASIHDPNTEVTGT